LKEWHPGAELEEHGKGQLGRDRKREGKNEEKHGGTERGIFKERARFRLARSTSGKGFVNPRRKVKSGQSAIKGRHFWKGRRCPARGTNEQKV